MQYDELVDPEAPGGERPEDLSPEKRRAALRHIWGVYGAVTAACVLFFQLSRAVGVIRFVLGDLIAALFLFVPTLIISRRREDFASYGLVVDPLGRGLLVFMCCALAVFPAFAAGSFLFYRIVCQWQRGGVPLPRAYALMCPRFVGSVADLHISVGPRFAWRCIAQLGVVALPEEYFFRGYLQTKVEALWPPRRTLLGGKVGSYLLITSILFALGHVLVDLNPLRLAVFLPSLLFGWMRSATGSIVASVLFHASSNIVSEIVHRSLGFS